MRSDVDSKLTIVDLELVPQVQNLENVMVCFAIALALCQCVGLELGPEV